jgi:hypothetical protein
VVDTGQYKKEFTLPCQRASFSGDAVECLSLSRKLTIGERAQHLDGWPLHVTIYYYLLKSTSILCHASVALVFFNQ